MRLPRAGEAVDTVVQPDLLLRDPARLDERGCRSAAGRVVGCYRRPPPGTITSPNARCMSAQVREYWLVHQVDLIVTVYRLHDGRFGVPEVCEFSGRQAVDALAQVEIDWEPIAALRAD